MECIPLGGAFLCTSIPYKGAPYLIVFTCGSYFSALPISRISIRLLRRILSWESDNAVQLPKIFKWVGSVEPVVLMTPVRLIPLRGGHPGS